MSVIDWDIEFKALDKALEDFDKQFDGWEEPFAELRKALEELDISLEMEDTEHERV